MFGFNKRQKSNGANKSKKSYDYEYDEENFDFTSDKKEEFLEDSILRKELKEAENLHIDSHKIDDEEIAFSKIAKNKIVHNKIKTNYEDNEKQIDLEVKINPKVEEKFKRKEKQSYNFLKYKYNDSKTDNLNTNIQNKYKLSSYSDENVIYDMDAENLSPQQEQTEGNENESENFLDEIDENLINSQSSESEPENSKFKHKIKEIKDLRQKKREIEHKEETYDQDYVEMKQAKTSELIEGKILILIKDVYNLYESNDLYNMKDIDNQSDSEKEVLQWELEKLKHGINSKWAMTRQKKTHEENRNKNIFEIFNTIKLKPLKISEVVSKVQDDIINTQLNYESLKVRKENYENEILENAKRKEECINKVDEHIKKYLKLKDLYYRIIKSLKKKGTINSDKITNMIKDEEAFNLSN